MAKKEKKKKKERNQKKKKEKPAKKAKAKLSSKLEKLITEIEGLSVLELSDLVKALEDKFGAITPMAPAPTAGAPTPAGEEKKAPEKTSFNVILAEAGANKINVIKTVREINQSLGLKEAKDLVEAAPKELLTDVKKEEAEEAKKKLEEAGAKVELK